MSNLFGTGEESVAGTEEENRSRRAETPVRLLVSAAVFGIAFSYLFMKQSMGLNITLFVLLLYSFALFNRSLFMKTTFGEEKLITFFSAPVIFLGAYVFIGSTFLNALSILVILFVMFVQYLVLSGNALYKWYQPMFLIDILFGGINRILLGLGKFIAGSVNSIFHRQSEKKRGAVIGVCIGILLLILIVPLLLVADPYIAGIASIIFAQINLGDIVLYILLFLIAASFATAPIATANREEYTGRRGAINITDKRPVQGVTAVTALSMVSLVYILFALVQFGYFFEPRATMASQLGLTSSAYAVRGFGELLFITCLNFIIIASALRFTKQKNGDTQGYLKALCTVLIAFNFIIMASSYMRLQYYEYSYGYTVARFISFSFMIFLLILNVIMLIRVYFSKIKVIKLFATAALLYFCVIVAVNPESYVARSNIQRYSDTGKIDAAYLFTLPGDAVSEACDFVKAHPEVYDENAKTEAQNALAFYSEKAKAGWQSLNIADQRAFSKLQQLN